jgi:hypothetical protein
MPAHSSAPSGLDSSRISWGYVSVICLIKVGRGEEAFEIIVKIRANHDPNHPIAQRKYREMLTVIEMGKESENTNYLKMFFGTGSGDIHTGRRIQLAFWLQVLMQYGTGIAAAVIYSGTIFRTAGFDDLKSNWLSTLLMMVGILSTAIAAFTLTVSDADAHFTGVLLRSV